MAALAALATWTVLIEPGCFRVHRQDLVLPGWPASLDGLTIAALGDIHAGAPHITRAHLAHVVEQVNATNPDVIVLLGDYVVTGVLGGRFMPPEEMATVLAPLRARLGVYAVLGNHDGWLDGARVRRALEAEHLRVLSQDAVPVSDRGATFWIVGLPDLWTGQPSIPAALDHIPAGAPIVLLEHSPDIFPDVPARVTLTLAAHTHGGQVRLPFVGSPIVPSAYGRRYAAGHIVEDGRHLFVTTGLGTSILPVRFGVVPEVAVLTLRAER
jgi:predicted MPP superfamily phosphohydrolase